VLAYRSPTGRVGESTYPLDETQGDGRRGCLECDMDLQFLGATDTVTGSKYLLSHGGGSLLHVHDLGGHVHRGVRAGETAAGGEGGFRDVEGTAQYIRCGFERACLHVID